MVNLLADGGEMTVSRPLASYVWGSWEVELPEGAVTQGEDKRVKRGFAAKLNEAEPALFERAFVRTDVNINVPRRASTVEESLDTAAKKTAGNVFFERDISESGLGMFVPNKDFQVGDLVNVLIWGKKLQLIVTSIEMVTRAANRTGWRVHVGGQMISDLKRLGKKSFDVERAIEEERRQRIGAEASLRSGVNSAHSIAASAASKADDATSKANTAVSKANTAESKADEAKTTVAQALSSAANFTAEARKYSEQAATASSQAAGYSDQALQHSQTARVHAQAAANSSSQAAGHSSAASAASEQARSHSEASRDYSSAAASESQNANAYSEAAAQAKTDAETARSKAEQARAGAETARSKAEIARSQAEIARSQAERSRSKAETARSEAETARFDAETARSKAETARSQAESERSKAETARSQAESERSKAEQARNDAEAKRSAAETARSQAESERSKAETARIKSETERVKANTARLQADIAREKAIESVKQQHATFRSFQAQRDAFQDEMINGIREVQKAIGQTHAKHLFISFKSSTSSGNVFVEDDKVKVEINKSGNVIVTGKGRWVGEIWVNARSKPSSGEAKQEAHKLAVPASNGSRVFMPFTMKMAHDRNGGSYIEIMYITKPLMALSESANYSTVVDIPRNQWTTVASGIKNVNHEGGHMTVRANWKAATYTDTYGVRLVSNGTPIETLSEDGIGPVFPWGNGDVTQSMLVSIPAGQSFSYSVQVYSSAPEVSQRRVRTMHNGYVMVEDNK